MHIGQARTETVLHIHGGGGARKCTRRQNNTPPSNYLLAPLTSCSPRGRLRQRRLLLSSLAETTRVAEGRVNYSSLIYRPASSQLNLRRMLQNQAATDLLCSSGWGGGWHRMTWASGPEPQRRCDAAYFYLL